MTPLIVSNLKGFLSSFNMLLSPPRFSFPASSPLPRGEVIQVLLADYQTWKGFPKFKAFHWLPAPSSVCSFSASALSLIVNPPASLTLTSVSHPVPSLPVTQPTHDTHVKCSQHNITLPIAVTVHVCEHLSVCLFKCLCLRIHLRPN